MTDRKWTPGPWAVEYKHGTTRLVAGGEVTMCDETYYPWAPENDADWHLIAAAPELYEALKAMVYETTHLSPEDDDGSHWCKISREALSNARAALAKARGQQ